MNKITAIAILLAATTVLTAAGASAATGSTCKCLGIYYTPLGDPSELYIDPSLTSRIFPFPQFTTDADCEAQNGKSRAGYTDLTDGEVIGQLYNCVMV